MSRDGRRRSDGRHTGRSALGGLGAPARDLGENDSYRLFRALGNLAMTRPTGTDGGDIQILPVSPAGQVENSR